MHEGHGLYAYLATARMLAQASDTSELCLFKYRPQTFQVLVRSFGAVGASYCTSLSSSQIPPVPVCVAVLIAWRIASLEEVLPSLAVS